jgi:hypothetical protein
MAEPDAGQAALASLVSDTDVRVEVEDVEDGAEGRRIFVIGNAAGRDRLWIQCDAAGAAGVGPFAAWAILESLLATRVNRYRHILLARVCVAVVPPAARASGTRSTAEPPPILDAGRTGATPPLVAALERFQPTLVIHLQDWGEGGGADGGAGGLRSVESFYLDPDLHRALGDGARLRSFIGRPTAAGRALEGHPGARLGAAVQRHVRRMGQRASSEVRPDGGGAFALAPGRFAPRLPWRRLGAANLPEIALARCGAQGLTAQTFGAGAEERAGQALAFAEGAVLYALHLETEEATP